MNQTLVFEPITAVIGASVRGVDLNADLPVSVRDQIYEGFLKYSVLVFPDQPLVPRAHVALAESIGPVWPRHPFYPSVAGFGPVSVIADSPASPPENEVWHSDMSADAEPPCASVLAIQTVPPSGGDTLFCSMYAVHDALSEPMRRTLESLEAVHETERGYVANLDNNKADDRSAVLRARGNAANHNRHPVIMRHPSTRRPLVYVNCSYTSHIVGLSEQESRTVLGMIYGMLGTPRFQMRLKWRPNTVAMFDNLATQHHAVGDHYPANRVMHRVTIARDKRASAAN